MRVLILFITLISFSAYSIEEIELSTQEVLVWNNVNIEALNKAQSDLSKWCFDKFKVTCSGYNVSTFINKERTLIYYQFDLLYVDGALAVYQVSANEQNQAIGKSWVYDVNYPFTIKPFKVSK